MSAAASSRARRRVYSVIILPDTHATPIRFRIQRNTAIIATVFVGLLIVSVGVAIVSYGDILSRAAQTDRLRSENQRLVAENAKVKDLIHEFDEIRKIRVQLAGLAGATMGVGDQSGDTTVPLRFELSAPARPSLLGGLQRRGSDDILPELSAQTRKALDQSRHTPKGQPV